MVVYSCGRGFVLQGSKQIMKVFCFEENDTFEENGTQVMVVYLNFLNLTCFNETGSR